ncbi:terpene synthase family protein [Micromonospora sp. WMMD558]|uniref:terpene synthase family protein n=1 Tax=Micromonospora sp. WMMD558 TaxID=3403462 RepID=UPI003BF5A34D
MPQLASGLLAFVPVADHGRLLDRAREVTARCDAWLTEYPIVRRPSVTAACALVSTVAMPHLRVTELGLLTRWWLWIFGVDDVFDDRAVPDERVDTWARRFAGQLPADDDALLAAYGSIRGDLSRYPLYPRFARRWRAGMADIVRGMLRERRWSAAGTPADQPGYDTYLRNGMTTISVRPYTVTAAILADEPAAADSFAALDPVIDTAARCFRLANDLRSAAREREEGTLNAVWLLQRDLTARGLGDAAAEQAARQRLRETCAADLAHLDAARRTAPSALATLTRFLWAHTLFVWNMYEVSDYDTASALLRRESGPSKE